MQPAPRFWSTEKSSCSGPTWLVSTTLMLFLPLRLSSRSMKHLCRAAAYCRAMVRAPELPGDKKILISGGADTNNLFMGMALFNPARIWTDRDDYYPDEPVILSGSGWIANEAIYLYAVDNETQRWEYGTTITADASGAFAVDPYFIVELRHLGVQFHVTAVGAQSAMQADVYFTDNVTGTLYENSGRTIKRDAFVWGATVYLGATFNGQSGNRCCKVEWVNPSNTVVQTAQFEPNTLADSFLVPSSGPSGIWQVKLYEAN